MNEDYEVGHGKPPKKTQFKKGQSGNPKGRPKNSKNFRTDLDEVLGQPVTVNENGKTRTVSSQMAVLKRLREQALKGDPRALDRLLKLAEERSDEVEAQQSERSLSQSEKDILTSYEEMIRNEEYTVDTTKDESDK